MKFKIDRSNWRNAKHGKGHTQLLNSEGFSCCMGLASLQLGAAPEDLFGVSLPEDIHPKVTCEMPDDFTEIMFHESTFWDSGFVESCVMANDNEDYTDEQRERQLQSIAAEYGHEFEFVGEFGDSECRID